MKALAIRGACGFCKRPMSARSERRYCSDLCRFQAWKFTDETAVAPCHYCGMPADTVDHLPRMTERRLAW